MDTPNVPHTNSVEEAYCPDRRTALSAMALAAGGLALQLMTPRVAFAKSSRKARKAKVYYPILYSLDGGKNPRGQIKKLARKTRLATSSLKKPRKKGYKFVNWYANRKLTKEARYVYGRALRTKRTLYAKWKPIRYRITYELNGGQATKKLPAKYTIESKRITPRAPERKGYKFAGWYADKKFKKRRPYIKEGSTGDKTFFAKWELETYSIEYDLAGGTPTLALPASYTVKSSRIKPFAPTRGGYRFDGWYADSSFNTPVTYINPGSTGDKKFFAKWVPTTYWDEHLAGQCARVNELAQGNESAVPSFVYITDMHLPSNALVSIDLVQRVLQDTDANMVVFGGDAMNNQAKKAKALAMLSFVRNAFPGAEMHFVRGNHDANSEGSSPRDDREITNAEYLKIAAGKNEVREGDSLDYYRDDATHKVRYIFVDTGAPLESCVTTLQLGWLKEKVLELEEGWTVLVFAHKLFANYPDIDTNGRLIMRLLDQVYDESKAQIAGVISGHMHYDRTVWSDKGYPLIGTICDAYGKCPPDKKDSRVIGTIGEQAFDVVSLDTCKKKLYLTRIGAGKDREYQYAKLVDTPPEQDDSEGEALQAASCSLP